MRRDAVRCSQLAHTLHQPSMCVNVHARPTGLASYNQRKKKGEKKEMNKKKHKKNGEGIIYNVRKE